MPSFGMPAFCAYEGISPTYCSKLLHFISATMPLLSPVLHNSMKPYVACVDDDESIVCSEECDVQASILSVQQQTESGGSHQEVQE